MYWLRPLLPQATQVTMPQAESEHAFETFDRKLLGNRKGEFGGAS